MNKSYKFILIVIVILIGLILIDTLQAKLLKHSPFISWKENLEAKDSYVDRGILMDTYYCVKEKNMVEVSWHLKTTNFTCFEASTNESDGGWYIGASYSIDNLSMQIKEGTLTNKSLTLVIKDSTNEKYFFGQEFYLEKQTNNVWSKVKKVHTDYAFNQMAYYADNKELELKQDWDYIYGTLEKGTYRLVKKVFKNSDIPVTEEKIKLISVDFEIK